MNTVLQPMSVPRPAYRLFQHWCEIALPIPVARIASLPLPATLLFQLGT